MQAEQIEFLGSPAEFKTQIIELIRNAKKRIYVTALYWQKDEAGQEILDEIYRVKQENPHLDVKILIDWTSRTTQFIRCRKIGHQCRLVLRATPNLSVA